jgi:glycerate dehydrogenase
LDTQIKKIVFLDSSTLGSDINLKKLEKLGELKLYETTTKAQTLNRVKDADIVISNKVVIDKEIIKNSNIKLICVAATGMNNIDIEYATSRGIEVKNVSGYSTQSVVNITFATVLNLLTKLNYYDSYGKDNWKDSAIFTNVSKPFNELYGKTWGIIGLGSIGKAVAKIAASFGCRVIYYSTSGNNNSNIANRVDLKYLLKNSDIISIHAPLNDDTNNLLNYKKLSRLKDGAILVNMGRGGIVNENDIAKIIDERELYFGLDVMPKEPIDKNHPLLKIKNRDRLILTPHIAWTSIEARRELLNGIINNIKEFNCAK